MVHPYGDILLSLEKSCNLKKKITYISIRKEQHAYNTMLSRRVE